MNIPSEIRAGDTIQWKDVAGKDNLGNVVGSSDYTLKYYLRTNTASEGHTATATADGTQDWLTTISATDSAGFDAGDWYWQAVATKTGSTITLGSGQLKVLASLVYSDTPGALDGRTQAQKDLDAVQAAIRTILDGGAVKEYSIGNRNLKKYDLPDLLALETKLKAEVNREQRAQLMANGLGNPFSVYVRF